MELMEKIKNAPIESGCYLFKDENGRIIYVGKAKILRNRVKQYFMKTNQQDDKGFLLAKLICDVEYRITRTERDALIKEYSLIRHYRPWFNIQHKTDRSNVYYLKLNRIGKYPSFEVTDKVNRITKDHLAEFKSEGRVKEAILTLNRVFKTPICKGTFEEINKPCLHYQLNQCLGPCTGRPDPEVYAKVMNDIVRFFRGSQAAVYRRLNYELKSCIEKLEFEKAQIKKQNIENLQRIAGYGQSRISIPKDKMVILFLRAYRESGFSVFYINNGEVIRRNDFETETAEEKLTEFLAAKDKEQPQKTIKEITIDCLENIHADKMLVMLPANKRAGGAGQLVKNKFAEWI